jgi:nucleoside triphosphate pyrophosphatase
VCPADVDETLTPGPLPDAVRALALAKARAVAAVLTDAIVLGADTIVAVGDRVFGKPANREHARATLEALGGRWHDVITGVAVVADGGARSDAVSVVSRVRMADLDEETISAYVASDEPLDKAGAYAVQGLGGALVVGIVGSYTNVIGLPLAETRALLEAFGAPITGTNAS